MQGLAVVRYNCYRLYKPSIQLLVQQRCLIMRVVGAVLNGLISFSRIFEMIKTIEGTGLSIAFLHYEIFHV